MHAYLHIYLPILAAVSGAGLGIAAIIRATCDGAATIIRARRGDAPYSDRMSTLHDRYRSLLRHRRTGNGSKAS